MGLVIGMASAAVTNGCGQHNDVARNPYVRKNLATLKTIPPFPSAKLIRVDSTPWRRTEQADAPIVGYATTRIYDLPVGTQAHAVVAFYRWRLRARWKEVAGSQEYVSLRKGDAYLHILAGRGRAYLEIDHDCYKGGDSPQCFGP